MNPLQINLQWLTKSIVNKRSAFEYLMNKMQYCAGILSTFVICVTQLSSTEAIRFTFELSKEEVECFYEHLPTDVSLLVEFQVIMGGSHDIDCSVRDPDSIVLYQKRKIRLDSNTFVTMKEGVYSVCFGNEFSLYTHKVQMVQQINHFGYNSNVAFLQEK